MLHRVRAPSWLWKSWGVCQSSIVQGHSAVVSALGFFTPLVPLQRLRLYDLAVVAHPDFKACFGYQGCESNLACRQIKKISFP